jgi:hypothetical protein
MYYSDKEGLCFWVGQEAATMGTLSEMILSDADAWTRLNRPINEPHDVQAYILPHYEMSRFAGISSS